MWKRARLLRFREFLIFENHIFLPSIFIAAFFVDLTLCFTEVKIIDRAVYANILYLFFKLDKVGLFKFFIFKDYPSATATAIYESAVP